CAVTARLVRELRVRSWEPGCSHAPEVLPLSPNRSGWSRTRQRQGRHLPPARWLALVSWSLSPDWSTGVLAPIRVSRARLDECRWPARPRGVQSRRLRWYLPARTTRALFVRHSSDRTHETRLCRLPAAILFGLGPRGARQSRRV